MEQVATVNVYEQYLHLRSHVINVMKSFSIYETIYINNSVLRIDEHNVFVYENNSYVPTELTYFEEGKIYLICLTLMDDSQCQQLFNKCNMYVKEC